MNESADGVEAWAVQVRKGLLELLVLNALLAGEAYGYDLARSLAGLPGGDLGEGTLYPLLSRLRLRGLVSTRLVESASGPARKYYRLTAAGVATLEAMNRHFTGLVSLWQGLRPATRRNQ